MNTKILLAGTILTALLAGTSAIAGDNDYLFEDSAYATTESVVAQKVVYQEVAAGTGVIFEDSNN
ncbi:MAG: hypothetical protein V7749_17765 [Cocleimonas sp.]